MTIENEYLLKLDLQLFADGDDDLPEDENPSSGEADLIAAIRNLKNSEESEEESDDDELTDEDLESDDEEEEDEELEEEDDEEQDDEEEEEEKPVKKKQSKEENAKFAAQRRQQELEQKVQAELERLKQESPEFKLAQQLSKQFGKSPEVIMQEMAEEELKREAEATKIPIERLRKERETDSKVAELEQKLYDMQFQAWQTQINVDKQTLQTKYPMLTAEDMDAAVEYILDTVQNVNIPLEQAVYSVHGQKIIEALAEQKVQDDLAKASGRKKKTPLPPNTTNKPQKTTKLSAEEKYAAKMFNMSEEEYAKYKQ